MRSSGRARGAATGTSVDLTQAEFDAVRKLLEDQQTWSVAGRGTVEDLATRIADCLPSRDGRTAGDAHAAALAIARGLVEFAVADLDPKLFQQVLMARLQRMETGQASALDEALLGLHAQFASVMDQLKLVLDRLPPGPAGRGEITVYLQALIDWLSSDPWPRDPQFGGSVLTPAAIERKLRITTQGRDREQDLDADALAQQCERLVILGGPGAGKTWLAKAPRLRTSFPGIFPARQSSGSSAPSGTASLLPGRYQTVAVFLKMLPEVNSFGATAEGAPVLAAMRALPGVLAYRGKLPAPLIPGRLIDEGAVNGPWRRLVFGHPAHEGGAVSRHAYAFCVLEQFWRGLKRRDIYADASTRWRNPQARLLEGSAWAAVRGDVLTALGLPGEPGALLAGHARALDAAYREVGGRLAVNADVRIGDDGKIHLTGVKAIEEPPSLVDLRARTAAMLPRVDLPEVILEVMSWAPELAEAFTPPSPVAGPG